ncbi:allene oxide synthase-lipoxygenase protein-like [Gigantopelta aegis]|uniref:allene oxide synthase-lipoxygenase protein-like n=1 Tax=Gigantopelta aegis TaxID=1735272 RepID=UPI001B8878A3|nr:allene oxide synthase-lipoxygenase protein-like [Gigantopelta aegis]
MGCCMSGPKSEFLIYVRTGDKKNAGTDANVFIILHDDQGNTTGQITLDNFLRNDFERGRMDTFPVPRSKLSALGKITKIEVWRDDVGFGSDWYVERIMVENKVTNYIFVFPIFRWIKPDYHYMIKHLDTSLPQEDDNSEQRKMELAEKKSLYQFEQKIPGMPAQIKQVPPDEQFSFDHKWDIVSNKIQLIAVSKIVKLTAGNWESLSHLTNLYTKKIFHVPQGADRWSNDLYFGNQRVACLNNCIIELCTSIPTKLAVTEEMLKPLLEGLSIQEALDDKRLFLCDYTILTGVPCKENFICPDPIGLFFVNGNKRLVPIAIQLFQTPAPDNPVFLPTDPPNTWAIVKMWFNLADCAVHQSLTHLAYTHLLMEGVSVATQRNLSQSHPLFKLLAPHFLYIIAINSRGLETLISPNGWVEKVMNIGTDGMFHLIKKGLSQWRVDVHGTLPEELRRRGFTDSSILPGYHFRDDALLLYDCIDKYVTNYVKLYYKDPSLIKDDWELQAWGKELVKDKEDGGVGLLGVPSNGKFSSVEDIVKICRTIVYTCSVSHASANFPQYEEYGFPPNYPSFLRGDPPKDKLLVEYHIRAKMPKTPEDLIPIIKCHSWPYSESLFVVPNALCLLNDPNSTPDPTNCGWVIDNDILLSGKCLN